MASWQHDGETGVRFSQGRSPDQAATRSGWMGRLGARLGGRTIQVAPIGGQGGAPVSSSYPEVRRGRQELLQSLLTVVATRSGRLPAVGAVRPYGVVGVSPSKYLGYHPNPPYVRRDLDRSLEVALGQRGFVLVVGPSKAGKSRTAFEGTRRMFPASRLIVPFGVSEPLVEILRHPPFGADANPPVLWLDEFDRYLGDAGGFERELLGWLMRHDRRMVVVATISLQRRDAVLSTGGEIGRTARLLIERATELRLDSALSAKEQEDAEDLYPAEDFSRGIGEQLVGAPLLERNYSMGRFGNPVGWALVKAAIDWRRAGLARPIPESDLRDLFLVYVNAMNLPPPTRDLYRKGLAWACQQIVPKNALLTAIRNGRSPSFRASDYLVAYADGQGTDVSQDIPDAAWDFVITRAMPEEVVRVGFTAYTRQDQWAALAAWSQASRSGHPEAAPWAALNLGLLHKRQGDLDQAGTALQQAARSRHPEAAPLAALNLKLLHKRHGDLDGAGARPGSPDSTAGWSTVRAAVLEEVLASRRPDEAPGVAVDLGVLLAEQGDTAGARAAFEQAIASKHPDEAPRAALDLGRLLAEQGDTAGARAAFEQAIASRHANEALWAMVGIGELLTSQGNRALATQIYRQVIDSGSLEVAQAAAQRLEPPPRDEGS